MDTQAPANRAIAVHRNTTLKGLIDALAANYPTIVQLVGKEWFAACASEYVRTHPARSPALVLYGESFPAFLSSFEPAATLPYLFDVARIDRMWIEAHTARDAESLSARTLAGFSLTALSELRVPLHPATRIGWFKHSAATIWIQQRSAAPESEWVIEDREEGLLLSRPEGEVQYTVVQRAGFTLLDQIRAATTLGNAMLAALETEPDVAIAGCWAQFITAGAFAGSFGGRL